MNNNKIQYSYPMFHKLVILVVCVFVDIIQLLISIIYAGAALAVFNPIGGIITVLAAATAAVFAGLDTIVASVLGFFLINSLISLFCGVFIAFYFFITTPTGTPRFNFMAILSISTIFEVVPIFDTPGWTAFAIANFFIKNEASKWVSKLNSFSKLVS